MKPLELPDALWRRQQARTFLKWRAEQKRKRATPKGHRPIRVYRPFDYREPASLAWTNLMTAESLNMNTALADDTAWFGWHPERQWRLRRAYPHEVRESTYDDWSSDLVAYCAVHHSAISDDRRHLFQGEPFLPVDSIDDIECGLKVCAEHEHRWAGNRKPLRLEARRKAG
jgi:hypothetical protein